MAQTALSNDVSNHLRSIRERFYKINRKRLMLTQECLAYGQRDFLELLPLLFHVNHPELPGYISPMTPAGVSEYSQTHTAIKAAKKFFPEFEPERKARHQMDIHALFCMGSSGTIAYNNKSDFDIWLIHGSDISPQGLEELAEKARLIEEWALEFRLEVHFFVFDDLTFKQGQHDNLSSESSGSAQHYLLLDEFYRSSLLIAGRYPVWWLVPPDKEDEYDSYVSTLINNKLIDKDDIVDFGHVASIPTDEFFGAAVWQLYKGIDSPFKSVQKLLLMEVYASEYPDINILSMLYKRAVYSGEMEFTRLDPYIMMYRKIEEYLMISRDKERLDLFRKCFYFKINLKMGKQLKQNNNWRRETMQNLILDWGWDDEQLAVMDSKETWRIENVVHERSALIKAFTQSYHFLSAFAKKHAEVSRVTASELNVLGRKLYAAFERKSGKVEIINRGIAPDILEQEISICQIKNKDGRDKWLLYRGNITPEKIGKTPPLKMAQSVIELLAWSFFNHIIGMNTAISVHTQARILSAKEIKGILAAFENLFPKGKIQKANFNDLNHPTRVNTAVLFINTGIKAQQTSDGSDIHLSSNRINALSYGGFHENLAKSFDMVVATSWEEILIYRYEGVNGLLECIKDYLRWAPLQNQIIPTRINGYCFGSSFSKNIANRMEDLFASIINALYGHPHAEHTRFNFMVEDKFFTIEYSDGSPAIHQTNSYQELTGHLARHRTKYSPVIFDTESDWYSPIPTIYKLNRPSIIQMFFFVENKEVKLYIVDERGSLFTQIMSFHDSKSLINHFILFFASITKRRNILLNGDGLPVEEINAEFYLLTKDKNKTFSAKLIDVKPEPDYRNFYNIQVLGDLDENKKTSLTIYCKDKEFTTIEHGENIFSAVANHVLRHRTGGRTYPIYITDIDLSRSLFFESDVESLQSIHFLEYKKRIEDKLNKALADYR